MNNNGFKPGDLALLIKAHLPENVMKVVTLESSSSDEIILFTGADGVTYGVRNDAHEVHWIVCAELVVITEAGDKIKLEHAIVPQSSLMPLNGDFEPEEEDQNVLLSLQN